LIYRLINQKGLEYYRTIYYTLFLLLNNDSHLCVMQSHLINLRRVAILLDISSCYATLKYRRLFICKALQLNNRCGESAQRLKAKRLSDVINIVIIIFKLLQLVTYFNTKIIIS